MVGVHNASIVAARFRRRRPFGQAKRNLAAISLTHPLEGLTPWLHPCNRELKLGLKPLGSGKGCVSSLQRTCPLVAEIQEILGVR